MVILLILLAVWILSAAWILHEIREKIREEEDTRRANYIMRRTLEDISQEVKSIISIEEDKE